MQPLSKLRFVAMLMITALAVPAQAQQSPPVYRPDVPGVLRPLTQAPQAPSEADIIKAFRAVYTRKASPRIAIFWNRELSDQISTSYRQFLQIDQISAGVGAVAVGPGVAVVVPAVSATRVETGKRAETGNGLTSSVASHQQFRAESAFANSLLGAGVRLIDRNTIIRLIGAQASDKTENMQAIEMRALQNKADYFVEVLQSDDHDSPFGAALQVKVIEIATGRILVNVSAEQSAKSGQTQFAAGGYGFEKQQTGGGAMNAQQIGKALALDTMAALSESLR